MFKHFPTAFENNLYFLFLITIIINSGIIRCQKSYAKRSFLFGSTAMFTTKSFRIIIDICIKLLKMIGINRFPIQTETKKFGRNAMQCIYFGL